MTKDKIKEVKAVYLAKNKIKHSKLSNTSDNYCVTRPFLRGLIEKLDKKD